MGYKSGSPEKAYEQGFRDAKKPEPDILNQIIMGRFKYDPPDDYEKSYKDGYTSGKKGK